MAIKGQLARGAGARGESFLQVGEDSYPILFTNRGIFKAERILGKPVLQITSALDDQTLSMGDLVRLLFIGLEDGRRDAREGTRPYVLNDAWDILDTVGFGPALVAVFGALGEVLSYSREPEEADDLPPGD